MAKLHSRPCNCVAVHDHASPAVCEHEKRYNEQCGHFALMHVEGFVFLLSKALVQRHTSDIGMVTSLADCYNT